MSIKIEAETMDLTGYRIESGSFASDGQFIGLVGGDPAETGTASFTFSGPSGLYQVVVGYFDEGDGVSRLEVFKSGVSVDAWDFNQSLGSNRADAQTRTSRVIATELTVNQGQTFQIRGEERNGEPARIDYVEFIPIASSEAINGTNADDVLIGDAQDNTLNGFGGNDVLIAGTGDDKLNGGEGSDTASYTHLPKGIIANLDTGVVLSPLYGVLTQPKIMPLGDSITAGQHSFSPTPGAYRIQLWDSYLADGLSVNFVGSQSNGPDSLGDQDHEGYPGWQINRITSLVNSGILETYQPDVVLLKIGTNDTRNRSLSQMRADLSNLIDRITGRSPNTQLVVTSITPIDPAVKGEAVANQAKDFNALLPDLISDKAAQGKKVSFVNVGGSLTLNDMLSDGIHPTAAGYDKMGRLWYDTLIERDTLTGIENIAGTNLSDRLTGNVGVNLIKGGAGRDILAGGGNIDTFAYKAPGHGGDTITDFSGDLLNISASGFRGGLRAGTSLSTTNSATGVFVSDTNPTSKGTSANFLYNIDTGLLSFDRDGTNSSAAVTIATLTGAPSLNSDQFVIAS